jgi:hypothetical protein
MTTMCPRRRIYISLTHYAYSSEEEDISTRHYMHIGRKKKKGGSLECLSVKPKHKGLFMEIRRGAGAIHRQHRCSDWEEGDAFEGSPLGAALLPVPTHMTPAEPWSAPLLYEFPLLRRAPPLAAQRPPLRPAPPSAARRPPSPPDTPPLDLTTPPAPPYSTIDTFAREWRKLRLGDLGVDATAYGYNSRQLPPRRCYPPAVFPRRRFATFPGRSSRTMWRR